MNTTKNMILNKIDEMKDVDYYAEMNVLNAMVDTYCKAAMILENCDESTDVSSFRLFQEGYYMEDGEEGDTITKTDDGGYKINNSDQTYYTDKGFRRMKEDGSGLESIVWSIIAVIPRLIGKLIKEISNAINPKNEKEKTEKASKTVEEAKNLPNNSNADNIDNEIDSFVEKHRNLLIGGGTAVGIAGLSGIGAAIACHINKKRFLNKCDTAIVNIIQIINKNDGLKSIIKIPTSGEPILINVTFDSETGGFTSNINIERLRYFEQRLFEGFKKLYQYIVNESAIDYDINNAAVDKKDVNPLGISLKNVQAFNLIEETKLDYRSLISNIDAMLEELLELSNNILPPIKSEIEKYQAEANQLSNKASAKVLKSHVKSKDAVEESKADKNKINKINKIFNKEIVNDIKDYIIFIGHLTELIEKYKDSVCEQIKSFSKELFRNQEYAGEEVTNNLVNAIMKSFEINDENFKQELIDFITKFQTQWNTEFNVNSTAYQYGTKLGPDNYNGTSEISDTRNEPSTTDDSDVTSVSGSSSDTIDLNAKNPNIPTDLPDEYEQGSYVEKNTGWSFSFNG